MLFLLFASPWFIFADLLFLAAIVTLTEREMGTFAGLLLAIATGAFLFFSHINPLTWLVANPGTFFIGIGAYLVVGILWSLLKWFFYTRKEDTQDIIRALHKEYKKHNADAAVERASPSWTPERASWATEKTFDQWLKKNSHHNPLDPSKNKIRITRWMVWWPTSIIWTVLSDLVINVFNFIYDKLAFLFKSILDAQIKRAIKDVE